MSDIIFCNLNNLGLLACSGKNTNKFLQGQLSCDLNKVTMENTQLGVYCNPQGRVIATFRCFLYLDDYYLQMPTNNIDNCLNHLKKYAVFSKVNCRDVRSEFSIIGFYGQDALKFISNLNATKVIQVPGKLPRFEVVFSNAEFIQVKANLTNVKEMNADFWKLLDFEMGIPTIYFETQEQFLPHRINYHLIDGISFSKGCYVGQEIIARTQYRGTLKHHMYRLALQTTQAPKPGTPIFGENKGAAIGHIVDSACVDDQHCQALAVLAIEHAEITRVMLGDSNSVPIKLLDLPYQLDVV